MPVAIPSLATALVLIAMYGGVGDLRTSWTFILIDHVLFTLPLMVRPVRAVMLAIDLKTLSFARTSSRHETVAILRTC